MDRLQTDVKNMITHVASLPKGATVEQLTGKVKSLTTAIQKDTVALPRRIKDIVQQAFLDMGWDVNRQRIVNVSKFTHEGLTHSLAELLNNLQNWAPAVTPTDKELSDLSVACDRLWELDAHRLVPDVDYVLNLQQGKRAYDQHDAAQLPLFTFVDEKALLRPTYASFIALLDNYSANTGVSEVVTAEEKAENAKFLNLVMDTAVMQYVHQYLLASKKTKATSRDAFIRELDEMWFGLYARQAHNDSSGFEHVFVGEIKDGEITGFHNWIQIYLEERKSLQSNSDSFDYRGFIKPKRRALSTTQPRTLEQLVTIQFSWQGALKTVSSSLIGTSPEFELALYTICFFSGLEECDIRLGPYRARITCYRWPAHPRKGDVVRVATSFPSEAPLDEEEVRSGCCCCCM